MKFRLVFELEPPRIPDLKNVMLQLEIMGPTVGAVLIPDNHLGRAGLSSVALAIEVKNQGFTPIVALNARDRNVLRLRSDFLTLQAYGVEEVLLLYGDSSDAQRSDLTVRRMLEDPEGEGLKLGVVASSGRPLGWRGNAEFVFTKLAFGFDVEGWKKSSGYEGSVYCGVIAMSTGELARKVFSNIPDLTEPPGFLSAIVSDRNFGFETALNELDRLHESGATGAHLVVPAGRRRFAALLQEWLAAKEIRR
jgi:methylenetetrahydrofolate reductase (NADPH)